MNKRLDEAKKGKKGDDQKQNKFLNEKIKENTNLNQRLNENLKKIRDETNLQAKAEA